MNREDVTVAYLANGKQVLVPERQYMPGVETDRKYRTEPLRGSAHTLAVFFNPAPGSNHRWVCVGWTVKS